ncbi:alpha/beta hydrolase [Actinopolymorpha sp. B17G11]|uniref:alpha/beta hydrolase family protein n=1 Tax=Actinopolymorpha sp. B17G11 TaxID=3160861 RepID=UPI0032E4E360
MTLTRRLLLTSLVLVPTATISAYAIPAPPTTAPASATTALASAGTAADSILGSPSSAIRERAGVRAEESLRPRLPEPTGPHRVGTTELHLVDRDRRDPWVADRQRELMVGVWYPARASWPGESPTTPYFRPYAAEAFGASADMQLGLRPGQVDWAGIRTHARTSPPVLARPGGRPVVVFSPGARIPRALGTVLVEELASRGYVVVTVDHTHEAPVEFPDGRLELPATFDGTPTERNHVALAARVADVRFVLDQLGVLAAGGNPDADRRRLPDGLGGMLDLTRVGMFGHSAGGFATAEAMLVDRRIDAGIDMDGSMAYSFEDNDLGDVVGHGLDRPFMLMGAGLTSGLPHTHRDAPEWREFWANSTGWKRDLYVAEGEHFTFADQQVLLPQIDAAYDVPPERVSGSIGTVDPVRVTASVRAYVTAFFDQHLRHRHQRLLDGPSPRHPDVTFIR